MTTIYIPIAVEKELPEYGKTVTWIDKDGICAGSMRKLRGSDFVFSDGYDEIYFKPLEFSHWLKPVLISDLITAVQNSIAPQRQDLHTAIEISINEFFNKKS